MIDENKLIEIKKSCWLYDRGNCMAISGDWGLYKCDGDCKRINEYVKDQEEREMLYQEGIHYYDGDDNCDENI